MHALPRQTQTARIQYLDLSKGNFALALGELVKEVLEGGGALLHIPLHHDQPPHHPLPLHLYLAASHASQLSHVRNMAFPVNESGSQRVTVRQSIAQLITAAGLTAILTGN